MAKGINTGNVEAVRRALAEPASVFDLAARTGLDAKAIKGAVGNLTARGEAQVVGHTQHPRMRREISLYQLAAAAPNPWDCRALLEIAGPRPPSWMGRVRKVRGAW